MENKTTVLIAEDEQLIAKDISATLSRLGYEVKGMASTAEEVISKANVSKPDIILMDIMLEGKMTGIDAAEKIKSEADIPIIYLTALADNETIQKAKITEPFGYILKPYDERMLHSSIEMALYKHKMSSKLREKTRELEEEKKKSEKLLYNILPIDIVNEFKENGNILPRKHENVTLMFTDFEGFTSMASNLPPENLVFELNDIFKNFDTIIEKYGLEKLKTIGDSYMVAGGLPNETKLHAKNVIDASLEMNQFLASRNSSSSNKWNMRVGIHSGSVIAGVIGKNKFTYDVWGETVNIANRMEKNGEPGKINISESTYNIVKDEFKSSFYSTLTYGKKNFKMYFVEGLNKS